MTLQDVGSVEQRVLTRMQVGGRFTPLRRKMLAQLDYFRPDEVHATLEMIQQHLQSCCHKDVSLIFSSSHLIFLEIILITSKKQKMSE